MEPIGRAALFSVAKALQTYRTQGGTRTGVLPDFVVDAHEQHQDFRQLTRNSGRCRTYFPAARLVVPD
jgi:hypothetical protein